MLKGIEGRRILIDGDYRGAVAAFAAATNLCPKRVTIFHQGCVEVYEKLGEYLRAERTGGQARLSALRRTRNGTGVLINLRI